MLLLQDASAQAFNVVAGQHRNFDLRDHWAAVKTFIDIVDSAARLGDASGEGLTLSVQSGEGGQQRRVDVEDAPTKGFDEVRAEQPHVTSETDEIDIGFAQDLNDSRVEVSAFETLRINRVSGQ